MIELTPTERLHLALMLTAGVRYIHQVLGWLRPAAPTLQLEGISLRIGQLSPSDPAPIAQVLLPRR